MRGGDSKTKDREKIDGKVFLLAFKPPRKGQVSDFTSDTIRQSFFG